jgi:SAM-dependent methyltransferase
MRDPNEKYHDHVANIYNDMYSRSPYWDFYRDISWSHMKDYLPRDLSTEVHDAGCGTGLYGLKLLKAGFRVVFSDISARMLDVARRKVDEAGYTDRADFLKMDLARMSEIVDGRFGFLCAQGDPLSLCGDSKKAVREIARTLAAGGMAVLSVDNRAAGYEHYLEKADLEGMTRFHRTGVLTWLAERADERFPFQTFSPDDLEKLARTARLEVVSLIGKTVLPLRKCPDLLNDNKAYRELLRVERKLGHVTSNLGRAAHLQVVLRKP